MIDMTTNRIYGSRIFIPDCNKVEILRLMPKSAGFDVYLPHSVVEALHLDESDHSLIAFIDDSSSTTYLILIKDNDLLRQLRPLILSKREKAEALYRKLREQLQTQRQAEVEGAAVNVCEGDTNENP